MRVATNVFSAGQETTVRLLGSALKVLAERSDIQQQARPSRSLPLPVRPDLHPAGLTELHLEFTLAEAALSPEHAITEQ